MDKKEIIPIPSIRSKFWQIKSTLTLKLVASLSKLWISKKSKNQ